MLPVRIWSIAGFTIRFVTLSALSMPSEHPGAMPEPSSAGAQVAPSPSTSSPWPGKPLTPSDASLIATRSPIATRAPQSGIDPTQAPARHVSLTVAGSPSSQRSELNVRVQPASGRHVSVVQGFPSSQSATAAHGVPTSTITPRPAWTRRPKETASGVPSPSVSTSGATRFCSTLRTKPLV